MKATNTKKFQFSKDEITQIVIDAVAEKYGVIAKPEDLSFRFTDKSDFASLNKQILGSMLGLKEGITVTIVEEILPIKTLKERKDDNER